MANSPQSTGTAWPYLIGLGALILTGGCGEPVAIEIALVPNAEINAPGRVLEQVGKIEYVIDSSQGLYPKSAERRGEWMEIYDRDKDGAAEIVATVDITEMDRLPLMRLEQGGIEVSSVLVVIQGLARNEPGSDAQRVDPKYIAYGALSESTGRFMPGSVRVHEVEFNIKPAYRPPMVEDFSLVQQLDGSVTGVVLEFTKKMDHPSLDRQGVIQVLQPSGDEGTPVPGQLRLTDLSHPDPDVGFFTRGHYLFETALAAGSYRIEVSSQATDASAEQRHLDQEPAKQDDQPYAYEFVVTR